VGINGFGRIGRNFFRAAKQTGADFEFVAANDPFTPTNLAAHLLTHDTVLGRWEGTDVEVVDEGIKVNGETLKILGEREPAKIPWGDLGVDVVIESTGVFSSREQAAAHLEGGAPLVIVSAPSAGADATFVVGVNVDTFDRNTHKVISNASCTTNCVVPMVTVLVDGPSKDLREARAAAVNIIPSSTGAARATALVLEAMKGRLDGTSLRVPVPDGSITDFTAILNRDVTKEEVNDAFRVAADKGPLANVLVYSEEPIVSSDIVGSPASCTFDAPLTMVMGNLVKVLGWYDNEWGYSNRLVDLVRITAGK
ncbi:MAG TPA: type I glyceraldehyde-3-phosphate dehydrogenase, partial [Acidimicrobiales bacterium]|nr:type I glyceraldehyde-3-phosphate dehydrogenase [Acidimicrobiales bacterium]